jgi:hypothetical protein
MRWRKKEGEIHRKDSRVRYNKERKEKRGRKSFKLEMRRL